MTDKYWENKFDLIFIVDYLYFGIYVVYFNE